MTRAASGRRGAAGRKPVLPGTLLPSGKRRICVDLAPGEIRSLVFVMRIREAGVQAAVAEALLVLARFLIVEEQGGVAVLRRRDGRETELMIPLAISEER